MQVKRIYPVEGDASLRLMLLAPSITTENFTSIVPTSLQDTLREHGGTVEPFTIHRSYEDYSVEEAFQVLLPADMEHPSAFEQVANDTYHCTISIIHYSSMSFHHLIRCRLATSRT